MSSKSSKINNFLLIYDRKKGKLVEQREFGTRVDEALNAYEAAERAHREDDNFDIVLVGAESIESVKVTHASYFTSGVQDIESYLRSLMRKNGIEVSAL